MAAALHHSHLRSPNPSTRSYDSSSTSSATSPRLLALAYSQQQQQQQQQQNTSTGARLTAVTPGPQTSTGSMLPTPSPSMQYGLREEQSHQSHQSHQAYPQQPPYPAYAPMATSSQPPPPPPHPYHHTIQPYTAGGSAIPSGSESAASTPNPGYMPLPPSGGGGGGGGGGSSSGSLAGAMTMSPSMSPAYQQHHHHAQNQVKRAYRQRRKDPSCDACRERKVKCDATETTSCSECANRQVKCQFTKETNRRMSSMKQMQDLERQMDRMRRENSELRRLLHDGGSAVMRAESVSAKPEQQSGGSADRQGPGPSNTGLQLPAIGSDPRRRRRQQQHQASHSYAGHRAGSGSELPLSMAVDLGRVRHKLRMFAKGIWQPPTLFLATTTMRTTTTETSFPRSGLPPRPTAEPLLRAYYVFVQPMLPILHWPTFVQDVEGLYHCDPRSPSSCPPPSPASLAVLFAVLAVGCLFCARPHPDAGFGAADLAEAARELLDPWGGCSAVPTLDDARARLLLAVFLNESHLKSAAWTWLGSAVRVGQDLGLHLEGGEDGQTQVQEQPGAHEQQLVAAEIRRRIWWSMYILDRSLAMELGRPPLIDDDDCDVALPTAEDEQLSMLAVLHVVRAYTALGRILRAAPAPAADSESHDSREGRDTRFFSPHDDRPASSSSMASTPSSPTSPYAPLSSCSAPSFGIAAADLAVFEQHFAACLHMFPRPDHRGNGDEAPLYLATLAPVTYLLHARLLLHRANLMPACAPSVRRAAVEQCTRVALETASLVGSQVEGGREGATEAGPCTNLLVAHLFRCALFAMLAGHNDAAGLLVRALATAATAPAGTCRDSLATPCGRFLNFFASCVAFKRAEYGARPGGAGGGSNTANLLLLDEELLVYVSADLQATPEGAWVWEGETAGSTASPAPTTTTYTPLHVSMRGSLSEDERRDWGGWDILEGRLRSLATQPLYKPQQQQQPHHQPRHQPLPSPSSLSTPTAYSSPPYHYTTQTQVPPQPYGVAGAVKTEPRDESPRAVLLRGVGSLGPSVVALAPAPAPVAGKTASQERISIANII